MKKSRKSSFKPSMERAMVSSDNVGCKNMITG